MPNFETFTKRMIPLSKEPYVTIQRRGTISLTASAHQLLGSPKAVELLYDITEQIVGFQAVDATAEHAYPLRAVGNRSEGPFVLSGTAFTKYYGIDTSESRRRKAELIDGVLCIDLKDAGTVVTGNRAPTRRRTEHTTDTDDGAAKGTLADAKKAVGPDEDRAATAADRA